MSGETAQLHSDQLLDARLKRLAKDIEGLAAKDETALQHAHQIAALRRQAAQQLFSACSAFVDGINRLLPAPEVQLDPAEFTQESFQEDSPNLLQINVRG